MTDDTDTSAPESVQALREALDAVDARLLETAAERLEIIRRIARAKTVEGRSLFDRDREREVLAKARLAAAGLGLEPELAHDLLHLLVEASHRIQERGAAVERGEQAEARRFLIVGGRGQMGQLFRRAFEGRGHTVEVVDKDDDYADRPAAIRRADIVMLAVPMADVCDIAAEVAPHVRDDGLLLDINSLKEEVCEVMARHCRGEIIGTHPMFGPTVQSLRRQKVVICPVRPGTLADWFQVELGRLGVELIEADPASHDRMMAVVQVLVHFRTLVMGEALRRTGVSAAESLRFTSPIYRLELVIIGRLFAQDPALYAEIEMTNPRAAEVLRHFLRAARDFEAIITGGDRERFHGSFREIADYFSGFAEEAMRLSDFLIETLVRRP